MSAKNTKTMQKNIVTTLKIGIQLLFSASLTILVGTQASALAQLPNGWKAHDKNRPQPKVVSPGEQANHCLLYTSPSPRDRTRSRMPSSA